MKITKSAKLYAVMFICLLQAISTSRNFIRTGNKMESSTTENSNEIKKKYTGIGSSFLQQNNNQAELASFIQNSAISLNRYHGKGKDGKGPNSSKKFEAYFKDAKFKVFGLKCEDGKHRDVYANFHIEERTAIGEISNPDCFKSKFNVFEAFEGDFMDFNYGKMYHIYAKFLPDQEEINTDIMLSSKNEFSLNYGTMSFVRADVAPKTVAIPTNAEKFSDKYFEGTWRVTGFDCPKGNSNSTDAIIPDSSYLDAISVNIEDKRCVSYNQYYEIPFYKEIFSNGFYSMMKTNIIMMNVDTRTKEVAEIELISKNEFSIGHMKFHRGPDMSNYFAGKWTLKFNDGEKIHSFKAKINKGKKWNMNFIRVISLDSVNGLPANVVIYDAYLGKFGIGSSLFGSLYLPNELPKGENPMTYYASEKRDDGFNYAKNSHNDQGDLKILGFNNFKIERHQYGNEHDFKLEFEFSRDGANPIKIPEGYPTFVEMKNKKLRGF